MDFLDHLGQAAQARILVIGDVMLDRYVEGTVERISPEAPVPVLRHRKAREMLGGAGNVAANLASLGGAVDLVGLVGQDADGAKVRQFLADLGIAAEGLFSSQTRPTSVKTRYLAQGQQVLRHDWEDTADASDEEAAALLAAFRERLASADIVVLSDYGKGTACRAIAGPVIEAARGAGKRVLVCLLYTSPSPRDA